MFWPLRRVPRLGYARSQFYQAIRDAKNDLVYEYRWALGSWWKYQILRRPRPEPGSSSVLMRDATADLYKLSPSDMPFRSMVGETQNEYTWTTGANEE